MKLSEASRSLPGHVSIILVIQNITEDRDVKKGG